MIQSCSGTLVRNDTHHLHSPWEGIMKRFVFGITCLVLCTVGGCGTSTGEDGTGRGSLSSPSPSASSAIPSVFPTPSEMTATVPNTQTTTHAPQPKLTTKSVPKPTTHAPQPTKTTAHGVYYKNCAEARAAGAAPMHRGEPGYRPGLDRDHDGIACDE